MEHVRRDYELIVDLRNSTVTVHRAEIVQLVPGGDLYRKVYGGTLKPLAEGDLHSGDWFVTTRVHPCLADAKQEAAAELERRGEHLRALAQRCHEIEEAGRGPGQ